MSKRSNQKARRRQHLAYERTRVAERSAGEKSADAPTAAGRVARELSQDMRASSHTSLREGKGGLADLAKLPRSAAQNALIACAIAVALWSVVYFEACTGAIDVLGLYQTDILMAVLRLAAMVVAAAFTIRAAIDTTQLPQVVRGWATVPTLFSFVDVVLMMVPGSTIGAREPGGEVLASVLSFGLGIALYALCAKAASEHPEATQSWRDTQEERQRQMADRARHPLRRFRK